MVPRTEKAFDYHRKKLYIELYQNGHLEKINLASLNIGVIGAGHLGRYHALNYARMVDVNLVGIYDLVLEKSARVAQESRSKVFDHLEDLLEKVEAVSIAVPTDHHFDVGKRIMERGVHCLIEKPVTQTVDEADCLIRLAEKKKLVFHVGHVERFNPALLSLAKIHLKPEFIEAHRLAPFNPRGTEVAVILDLMIHDIDIALHLVDSPVEKLDASGVAVVSDSIDIANVRVRFQNGCVANLTASRISQKKMRKMRIFQKDAYISLDFLEKDSEVYQLEENGASTGVVLGEIGVGGKKKRIVYSQPESPDINGLEKELEAFVSCVRGNRVPAVSGEEGRKALAVAAEIMESIEKK